MARDTKGRSSLLLLLVLVAVLVAIGSLVVGFLAVRSLVQQPEATVPAPTVAANDPLPEAMPTAVPVATAATTPPPTPSLAATAVADLPAPTPFFEGPFTYGTSFGGRSLLVYRLGIGPSVRAIIGAIHGGYEWNTVDLVTRTLEYLVENPSLVPDGVTLYLIPCANPDGYAAGTDRESGRTNDNNVDLNRNWDYEWQPTATHGDRPVDAGSRPFSEPETAALRDFFLGRKVETAIFYHSAMARVFYGAETEQSATRELAEIVSEATGYPIAAGVPGQVTTGDAIDWMSAQGLAGVEVELTTHEDIDWERNVRGLEAFLNWEVPDAFSASEVPVQTAEIGTSVQGRPIEVAQIGSGTRVALVVVGAIHGDEPNTELLVRRLMEEYLSAAETVPSEFALYFAPSINPDGLAADTRQNANGVDLNRNWPTDDWKSDAARTSGIVPGSGGPAPGSEPEVQALERWLLDTVKPAAEQVWLLSYHSAYPPDGGVQPGYSVHGTPGTEATQLAQRVVAATGYTYLATWPGDIPFTGELIHWCDVNGIWAADVELPGYEPPDAVPSGAPESALATHRRVLQALLGALMGYQTGGDTTEYVVQPGDALSTIAEAHGVTIEELMRLNELTDPDQIQIGQTLRVPVR